jgi:hypothetical protein
MNYFYVLFLSNCSPQTPSNCRTVAAEAAHVHRHPPPPYIHYFSTSTTTTTTASPTNPSPSPSPGSSSGSGSSSSSYTQSLSIHVSINRPAPALTVSHTLRSLATLLLLLLRTQPLGGGLSFFVSPSNIVLLRAPLKPLAVSTTAPYRRISHSHACDAAGVASLPPSRAVILRRAERSG